jgi:hypothetical protein
MRQLLKLGKKYKFKAPGNISHLSKATQNGFVKNSDVIGGIGVISSCPKKGIVVMSIIECQDPQTKEWVKLKAGLRISVAIDDIEF